MPKKNNMVPPPEVSIETWQRLYDAAALFRSLEPWTALYDTDFVAFDDPVTRQTFVASVMGNLGEYFALALHREREGLEFCRTVLEMRENEELDPEDVGFRQNLIMAEFTSRTDLEKADKAVLTSIKWSGPKRGKHLYAKFRSHRPHLYPWYINEDEARIMTLGFELMTEYFRWRQGENLAVEASATILPTYKRVQTADNPEGVWKLVTEPFPELPDEPVADEFPSFEKECEAIRAGKFQAAGEWELSVRPEALPIVGEGERPYFASVGLVTDAHSGMVLTTEIMRPRGSEDRRRTELLLKSINQTKHRPKVVYVRLNQAEGTLKRVCQYLGISLEELEYLPAIEEVREAMLSMMMG